MAESAVLEETNERLFYCHQCKKEIHITSPEEDPSCPECNSQFLEALDEQEAPRNEDGGESPIRVRLLHMELPPREERVGRRSPTDAELEESLSWRLSDIDTSTGLPRNPMDDMHVVVNSLMEATSPTYRGSWPPAPVLRIQERRRRMRPLHVRTVLRTQGPPTLLRVANDLVGGALSGGLPFPFPLHNVFGGPRNIGDYVTSDRNLDDIISQLLNQLEGGAPPADKETIDGLPKINVPQNIVDQNGECAVCQDKFSVNEEVLQLSICEHIFHADCITPWLKLHDTCPVCRIPVSGRSAQSPSMPTPQTVSASDGRVVTGQFDEPSVMDTEDML